MIGDKSKADLCVNRYRVGLLMDDIWRVWWQKESRGIGDEIKRIYGRTDIKWVYWWIILCDINRVGWLVMKVKRIYRWRDIEWIYWWIIEGDRNRVGWLVIKVKRIYGWTDIEWVFFMDNTGRQKQSGRIGEKSKADLWENRHRFSLLMDNMWGVWWQK